MAAVEDSQVGVPTGRATTISVYDYASAVLVVEANVILAVVEVGKVIRLGVVPAGK